LRPEVALSIGLDAANRVTARVSAEQLALTTPCPGWSVRDVLNHLVGVTQKFNDFASGKTDEPTTRLGDLLGDDHRITTAEVIASSHAAWLTADLSRTCHLSFGSFPAPLAAGINLFDALTHAWDVSVATGIELDCPDEVWDAALQVARVVVSPRDLRHYAPEQMAAVDAPPAAQLLAFLGRTP
jgi:uncharacterized protein (TIGR03086 family)